MQHPTYTRPEEPFAPRWILLGDLVEWQPVATDQHYLAEDNRPPLGGTTQGTIIGVDQRTPGVRVRVTGAAILLAPERLTFLDRPRGLQDCGATWMSATMQRRRRDYRPADVVYVTVTPATTLAQVLGHLPDRQAGTVRLLMVGPRPAGGVEAWALHHPTPPHLAAAGHWLDTSRQPVLRFTREASEATGGRPRTVEVHRAAAWWGEADYSTADCALAHEALAGMLRSAWDDGMAILASPATTGRDLILRSLPFGFALEPLPADLQHLIRSTGGQGRWEIVGHDGPLPGLWGYDLRFGYASMCRHVGGALQAWDDGPYVPWQRGRYLIDFEPPEAWPHVGILPAAADDEHRWDYPTSGRHTGWVDAAELHHALAWGWTVKVHARILFADADPLRTWREKLVRLWVDADRWAADVAPEPGAGTVLVMLRHALRAIVLHTIGALHGQARYRTGSLPASRAAEVPPGATALRRVGQTLVWEERASSALWQALARPDWSTGIWGRCRARVLDHAGRGALRLDGGQVVGIRTDGLYVTFPQDWPDDGAVGTLRPTVALHGPLPAPRTQTDLLRLTRGTA